MLVFNRADVTAQVFEEVRKAAPKYLYVAADGARDAQEEIKCNQVRAIFDKIDWDCELKTLFRDQNLGCGMAVSSAIRWFFDQVESGIVLEDDCLPNSSFFGFCSNLLDYYKDNLSVGHISGSNFQDGIVRGDGSYYFSAMTHVWGWASWKRVWIDYDYKITTFNSFDTSFSAFPAHKVFAENWKNIFSNVYQGNINTWDYQYAYLNLIKGYKCVMPNVNLIENIGFGNQGTHTNADHPLAVTSTQQITTIKHPTLFVNDVEADIYTQTKEFLVKKPKKGIFSMAWKKIKNYLKNDK